MHICEWLYWYHQFFILNVSIVIISSLGIFFSCLNWYLISCIETHILNLSIGSISFLALTLLNASSLGITFLNGSIGINGYLGKTLLNVSFGIISSLGKNDYFKIRGFLTI